MCLWQLLRGKFVTQIERFLLLLSQTSQIFLASCLSQKCWLTVELSVKGEYTLFCQIVTGQSVGGGGLGAVTLMTPEYLSIWNIKRWCQSRLSGCHYPSRGDEAGAIRRQVAWRQTAGTGHQLHVTSSCCTSSTLIQAPCDTLIPSHITQTYHHNPVTRRQVAWQPFMSSPYRTSRDPNTKQQTAGGWTGWIQIASGTQPPCFWVAQFAHQPVSVLPTKHLMTAEYSEVCRCRHRPTHRAIPVCYFYRVIQ